MSYLLLGIFVMKFVSLPDDQASTRSGSRCSW